MQALAFLHLLGDPLALSPPPRSRARQKHLNGRPFFCSVQFAQGIGNFIERIDIYCPVSPERQGMAMLELQDRYGRMAPRGENSIIRHLLDHRMGEKTVHLFFRTLPKTFRNGEIEKDFFARRRVGDFENDSRGIEKPFFKEIPFQFEHRQRREELLHSEDLFFPCLRILLSFSFRSFLARHPDHFQIHIDGLIHLVAKTEKTADHQKGSAQERRRRENPRQRDKDSIQIKALHTLRNAKISNF